MSRRFSQVDALKGLGILFVIIGHMDLSLVGTSIATFIYTFHMPLFFLVSGYLSLKLYKNFWELLKRKARSLLLPYTILFCISLFFGYILVPFVILKSNVIPEVDYIQILKSYLLSGGELTNIHIYNFPLWFLPCLFVAELCFYFLKKINNDWIFVGVLVAIAAITFPIQTIIEGRPPFHINVLPAGLVFMGIGYLFRKHESKIKINNLGIILIVLVSLVLSYKNPGNISLIINPIYYFISATLITYLLYISLKHCTDQNMLVYIGRNSLIIFGIHSLVILMYTFLPISNYFDSYNGVALFLVNLLFVVIICLIIVWAYNNIIKYFKRMKNKISSCL